MARHSSLITHHSSSSMPSKSVHCFDEFCGRLNGRRRELMRGNDEIQVVWVLPMMMIRRRRIGRRHTFHSSQLWTNMPKNLVTSVWNQFAWVSQTPADHWGPWPIYTFLWMYMGMGYDEWWCKTAHLLLITSFLRLFIKLGRPISF